MSTAPPPPPGKGLAVPGQDALAAAAAGESGPRWRLWMAPGALGLGIGLSLVSSVLVAIAGLIGGASTRHPTPAMALAGNILADLGFVAAAVFFASLTARPAPGDFWFRRTSIPLAVGVVLGTAVAYYIVTAVYASALHLHGTDKLPREFGVGHSTAALAGAAVFVCVVAPVAEEFFFRGFLLSVLAETRMELAGRDVSFWVAALVVAVLFGAVHSLSAPAQFLIPLGFLGFALCLVRRWTGSLYPCIALHSLNNSLALGVNELHWGAGGIAALIAGSLLVIAAFTGPLAGARLIARPV